MSNFGKVNLGLRRTGDPVEDAKRDTADEADAAVDKLQLSGNNSKDDQIIFPTLTLQVGLGWVGLCWVPRYTTLA